MDLERDRPEKRNSLAHSRSAAAHQRSVHSAHVRHGAREHSWRHARLRDTAHVLRGPSAGAPPRRGPARLRAQAGADAAARAADTITAAGALALHGAGHLTVVPCERVRANPGHQKETADAAATWRITTSISAQTL